MKRLFREAGLPVAKFLVLRADELRLHRTAGKRKIASLIRFPCFVKPANSGSSVGIHKVHSLKELDAAIDDALQYDEKILVEKGIEGREIECSVLGNEAPVASVPGEVIVAEEIYAAGDEGHPDERVRCDLTHVLVDRLTGRGLKVRTGNVVCVSRLALGERRAELHAGGAIAVDMESVWLAAGAVGRPFGVVRVVLDSPAHELLRPQAAAGVVRAARALRRVAGALHGLAQGD